MRAHTVHFIVKSFNMNQYKIGGGPKIVHIKMRKS